MLLPYLCAVKLKKLKQTMKKRTTLMILAAAVSAASFAQQYTIEGVAPSGATTIYLTPLGEEPTDSTTANAAGRFTFNGDAQGKHLAYVSTSKPEPCRFVVFLEGKVSVDLNELHAAGNAENTGLSSYQEFVNKVTAPLNPIVTRLRAKQAAGQEITDRELAEYYDLADTVSKQVIDYAKTQLKEGRDTRWPAYVVYENASLLEHDYLISLDNKENLYMGEPCLDKVKRLIAAYRRTQIGATFTDFELPDTAGQMHKLSEYVGDGHYVLLDFWATWCGPCMRELPKIKEVYEKYHDKGFDIVGISFDQDGESWRAVIKRKQMNWIHLSDLGGWKSLPVDFYGVRAIPFTMLIDPQGTIIGTGLNGEKLDEVLDNIFDR